MFKRNVTVTNSHQLSGKDVKRIVKEAAATFGPALSEKDVKKLIPSKSEVVVSKLSNRALVYTVSGSNPCFFEYDDQLYPTIYTLWEHPQMLPTLLTYSEVSPKVLGGADLMLPGVIVPEGGYGADAFAADEPGTVSIPDNPFPFAVGVLGAASGAIHKEGLKGKGLKLLHHYPDLLWSMGTKAVPNDGFRPARIFPCADASRSSSSGAAAAASAPKEEDSPGGEGDVASAAAAAAAGGVAALSVSTPPKANVSMDELVDTCFLRALHLCVRDSDLPMDCSKFYSGCMLPSRPPGVDLDIKQSSYKKLSKLIKKMEKRGLISTKQMKQGGGKEDHIVAVNRTHEAYTLFVESMQTEGTGEDASSGNGAGAAAQGSGGVGLGHAAGGEGGQGPTKAKGKRIEVQDVYRATSNLRPVFGDAAQGHNKDALFSAQEVAAALAAYARAEGLAQPQAEGEAGDGEEASLPPPPTALTLNKMLLSGMFGKKEGREVGTVEPFAEVASRLVGKMQRFNRVTTTDAATGAVTSVVRKGAIKHIRVHAEDRHAGRKYITRVTGLESFGIEPEELAGNLQRTFKTSSSVQKLPGKQETGKEVALQGNLLHEICAYLKQECGIDASFIETTSKLK